MVEMGTLVAILLGTIAGGIIGGASSGGGGVGGVSALLAALVVGVAVPGISRVSGYRGRRQRSATPCPGTR